MRDYNEFVSDLNKSQKALLAVAGYIQACGHPVVLPPHIVTPTPEDRYSYTDDMDAAFYFRNKWRKIQVKGTNKSYSSIDDYPYRMVTVDETYKIQKQTDDPPYCYFQVNNQLTGAIQTLWDSKPHWDTFSCKEARQNNRVCTYNRCPIQHCRWIDLTNPQPYRRKLTDSQRWLEDAIEILGLERV